MNNRVVRFAFYLIVLILIIKLVQSNPSRDDYNLWISKQFTNNTEYEFLQGIVNIVSEPILNASTVHTDYIICSVFETDLSSVGASKIKVIGVLGYFIPLSSNEY